MLREDFRKTARPFVHRRTGGPRCRDDGSNLQGHQVFAACVDCSRDVPRREQNLKPQYKALIAGTAGAGLALGLAELVHGVYALVPSVPVALSRRIIELTPGALATDLERGPPRRPTRRGRLAPVRLRVGSGAGRIRPQGPGGGRPGQDPDRGGGRPYPIRRHRLPHHRGDRRLSTPLDAASGHPDEGHLAPLRAEEARSRPSGRPPGIDCDGKSPGAATRGWRGSDYASRNRRPRRRQHGLRRVRGHGDGVLRRVPAIAPAAVVLGSPPRDRRVGAHLGTTGSRFPRRLGIRSTGVFASVSITVNRGERCPFAGMPSGWRRAPCPVPAEPILLRSVSCGTNARGGRL